MLLVVCFLVGHGPTHLSSLGRAVDSDAQMQKTNAEIPFPIRAIFANPAPVLGQHPFPSQNLNAHRDLIDKHATASMWARPEQMMLIVCPVVFE